MEPEERRVLKEILELQAAGYDRDEATRLALRGGGNTYLEPPVDTNPRMESRSVPKTPVDTDPVMTRKGLVGTASNYKSNVPETREVAGYGRLTDDQIAEIRRLLLRQAAAKKLATVAKM